MHYAANDIRKITKYEILLKKVVLDHGKRNETNISACTGNKKKIQMQKHKSYKFSQYSFIAILTRLLTRLLGVRIPAMGFFSSQKRSDRFWAQLNLLLFLGGKAGRA